MADPIPLAGPDPIDPTPEPGPAAQPGPGPAAEPAPAGTGATADAPTVKSPAKRRRRRWPFIVGGVLLFLVLLVVLLPTIASTGVVRSVVVGQVNKALNGRVQIDGWSLGWTSGQRISGVRVFDAGGSQIAELQALTTQLSLLDAIQGKYDFGETVIRGLDFNIKQYADGTNSVTRLVNSTSPKEETSSPIPSVNILLKLVDCRGTIDKEPVPGPAGSPAAAGHHIQLTSLEGQAKVTDINQPVENNFKAVAAVDNHAPGTLDLSGTIGVIRDNKVSLDSARGDETIKLASLDWGTVAAFLPADGSVSELRGVTDGTLRVQFPGAGKAVISADVPTRNMVVGGRAFAAGENFQADTFRLVIPPTTIDMSAGNDHWESWPLAVGDGSGNQQIALTATRGSDKVLDLSLAARTTLAAVMNASKNLKPGADGFVRVGLRTDVGKLGIPRTLAMQNSVQLRSGVVDFGVDAGFAADRADLKSLKLDVTDVAGRNTAESRDITLQPIHLAAKATSFGGGMAVPDLRDISLELTARGTQGTFTGPTLSALNGTLKSKLEELQGDLGQVIDLGGKSFKGDVTVAVSAQGNFLPAATQPAATQPAAVAVAEAPTTAPAYASGDRTLAATVTATGLEIDRPNEAPIAQKYVSLRAGGKIIGEPASPQGLDGVSIVALTGDEKDPVIHADLFAGQVRFMPAKVTDPKTRQEQTVKTVTVPSYTINHLDADLRRVQSDFGAFLSSLGDKRFDAGSVALTGSGSYDGKTLTFNLKPRLNNLTLTRMYVPQGPPQPQAAPGAPGEPAGGAAMIAAARSTGASAPTTQPVPVAVLQDYSIGLDLAGSYASDPSAGTHIVLTQFAGQDNKGWVTLGLAGGNLELSTPADPAKGSAQAKGGVKIGLALAPLNDVARKLTSDDPLAAQQPPAPGAEPPAELRDGRLDGTVQLTQGADAESFGVAADLDATRLSVARAGQPEPVLNNESLKVVLRSLARADFSSLKIDQCDLTGSFLDSHTKGLIVLKTPTDTKTGSGTVSGQTKTGSGTVFVPTPVLQMVRQLSVQARLDVPKAQALYDAWSPAKPAAGSAMAPASEPALPGNPVAVNARSGPVRLIADQQPPPGTTGRRRNPQQSPQALPQQAPQPQPQRPAPQGAARPAAANESAAAPRPPAPPAKFIRGTANVALEINTDNDGRVTMAPTFDAKDLAIAVGNVQHVIGDATVKTRAVIVPAPAPAAPATTQPARPLMEQIRELQLTELTAAGVGSTLKLKSPVVLRDPGQLVSATPGANTGTIQAGFTGNGNLGRIMALLDALGGQEPKPSYDGNYDLDQTVTTSDGVTRLQGAINLHDFVVKDDRGGDSFREALVRVNDNIATKLNPDQTRVIALDQATLSMESSKALAADMKGLIQETDKVRAVDVVAKVSYDGGPLWQIIYPKLKPVPDPQTGKTPEDRLKDVKVVGKYTRDFGLHARLAAGAPLNQTVRAIAANGSVALDSIDAPSMGLKVEKLDVPVWVQDGVVRLADGTKPAGQQAPPPATVNGGKLNLGNEQGTIALDLTGDHPRLSGPAGLKLFENIHANKIFAEFVGNFVNNPLLLDPKEASGVVNLTIDQLDRLPIDQQLKAYDPRDPGKAQLTLNLSNVQLGAPWLLKVQEALQKFNVMGENVNLIDWLQGDIKDYKIIVQHGVTSHDMTLALTKENYPLRMFGNVRIADRELMPMTINIPPGVFKPEITRYLPRGLELPLSGTVTAPQFDMGSVLQKNLFSQLTGPDAIGNLLKGVGGQKGNAPAGGNPQTQPAQPSQPNPLDIINGLINKEKKDKKDKGK